MFSKQATPNNWQKILSGLKKIKNIPQKTMGYINNPSMIEFKQTADNPQAVAYVTNEDYNNDGKTDSLKVHIVVPTFNTAFRTSDLSSMAEDSPEFKDAVERIAKTLIHEVEGHVSDFDKNNPSNPFPGGEAVAESAERSFTPVWASSTTNDDNKVAKGLQLTTIGEYKVKKELIKLANHLDRVGHSDLADRLDGLVAKAGAIKLAGNPDVSKAKEDAMRGAQQAMTSGDERSETEKLKAKQEREEFVAGGHQGGETPGMNKKPYHFRDGVLIESPAPDPQAATATEADAIEAEQAKYKVDVSPEVADDTQSSADQLTAQSSQTEDRITKMAKLISGQFSLTGNLVNR